MNMQLAGLGGRQLNGLIGARVSVYKGDHKTSNIAQHETGTRWAELHDVNIVGTFEDLDVSADKVRPFDRPDLKVWLDEERQHEWDVLIFNKVDRVFRSIWDCVQFAKWMKERRKILVFVDDGMVLNYLKPPGEMEAMMAEFFVLVGTFFAQIEVNRFKTRAIDAHSVLRYTERWAGGIPPEGFLTAPNPNGKGRVLVTDEVRRAMMHRAAGWLFDGDSFRGIKLRLDEAGIETARDYHRPPEKKQGLKWNTAQIIDMFTSLSTQGIKMTGRGRKARPVLDANGKPIQMAPPTFDHETWERVQQAVAARRYKPRSRVWGAHPLLDVVFCGLCQYKGAHRVNHHPYGKGTYRYYNCGNPNTKCSGVNSRAEDVEALLEQTFLERCAELPVTRKEFVPGEDHTVELEQVRKVINALREDRELGLVDGDEDERRYRERMAGLLARRKELERMPQRRASWQYVETGETYGKAWGKADQQGRRKMLVDAGVRFVLKGKHQWEVQIPHDIQGRLQVV